MNVKKFLSAVVILSALTSCGSSSQSESHDVWAMNTYMTMTAYGKNSELALEKAEEKINELDTLLSVTSEESDIWRINNSGGTPVEVSDDTADVISSAVEYCKKTGTLDITIYPVLREWGFTTQEYKIPDSGKLDELLENVNYMNIGIDGNIISVPENYMIDLGAVAKGYTGDRVISELKENGVESAIISLGGNVQSLGLKPDGSQWNVAVKNPFMPDSDMCIVSVGEKAVITSGDYERYFIGDDGKKYCHIIDKSDGFPADNGLVSVTIIGNSGI
ncbi:MAG: FAD:protein FMN transferase, partial [Ruminococcus sp.]|nr:FAD:protein FMN transferase [Ruminococcus sp.]